MGGVDKRAEGKDEASLFWLDYLGTLQKVNERNARILLRRAVQWALFRLLGRHRCGFLRNLYLYNIERTRAAYRREAEYVFLGKKLMYKKKRD